MSNVDWSKAPEGAIAYGEAGFRGAPVWLFDDGYMHIRDGAEKHKFGGDFTYKRNEIDIIETRPQQWPETDERIDNIGRNRTEDDLGHYNRNADEVFGRDIGVYTKYNAPERATSDELRQPVSAADFLSEGLKTLSERAKQYDPNGKKELSFNQVAQAFNAVTGKAITGADVCLMLVMLKIVRQNATERFHTDSAVDGINYMALWAELLNSSDQLK